MLRANVRDLNRSCFADSWQSSLFSAQGTAHVGNWPQILIGWHDWH